MEYINPLTGFIAILAISIIAGVVEGIKGRREKPKNPPPKKTVRRSRRKGWSAAASERWWKEVYDTGVLRKPFYRPKRRKHRSAYKIFW